MTDSPVEILDSIHEDADKLALMTEAEVESIKASLPGLVIEPNIVYKKLRHPMFDSFQILNLPSAGSTKRIRITVVDRDSGAGVEDACVRLLVERNPPTGFEATTDATGNCELIVPRSLNRFAALVVLPLYGYWSRLIENVSPDAANQVSLDRLPSFKSAFYDWGHKFADMSDNLTVDAHEIKIGVIDTGIRRDHPGITPTGGCNCVYGEDESQWERDLDGHGTHVAGIIAATVATSGRGIKGYVPRAKIRAYRAIGAGKGALTFDLVKAINKAVEDGCDIINMSLGSSTPQISIRNQTEMAYEKGVLCLAATGNDGGAVNYPAAFNSVMGVGAFGKFGAYPNDSVHRTAETEIRSVDGKYYFAKFSSFGDGLDFCAPGVAIVSTVPGGDYSAWDGTSMACPQVTGLAALALAANQDIFKAPRDAERVERLIKTLKSRTRKLSFGTNYEGAGYLTVPAVL
jgi:subtilisin